MRTTHDVELLLRLKAEKWLESIDDQKVREVARNGAYFAGGCIASLLLDEEPRDFDIYFRTPDQSATVIEHYLKSFGRLDEALSTHSDYQVDIGNALSLIRGDYCGDPMAVTSGFDFEHCTGYFEINTGILNISARALESVRTKTLMPRLDKAANKGGAVQRMAKFAKRGWKLRAADFWAVWANCEDPDRSKVKLLAYGLATD